MQFNTDTWEAFKVQLEMDPRFYKDFFNPDRFLQFFQAEAPKGINLKSEEGKKYANLNAGNISSALKDAYPITEVDSFNGEEMCQRKEYTRNITLRQLNEEAAFSFHLPAAQLIAKEQKFAIVISKKVGVYTLVRYDKERNSYSTLEFVVISGGGIKMDKPGTDGLLKLYYPSLKHFFKSYGLTPPPTW